MSESSSHIAVLIPCYNEELTIAEVIRSFRAELPSADIYVYDNNSSDKTAEIARAEGAIVKSEKRQGKGFVVQSMFQQIEADYYVMVDGDGTYPPAIVKSVLAPVMSGDADMVVGSRLTRTSESKFKVLNKLGNRMFLWVLNWIFNVRLTDILSGYRSFTRRFVKNLPLTGGGFETETELTIKALERGYRIVEVPCDLGVRPEGSHSKIRIWRDGLRILGTILGLFRDYKPLTFFGLGGLFFMALGLIPGILVTIEYVQTGQILRIPSAILAVGLVITGMLSFMVGLVLHTVVGRFREVEIHLRLMAESANAHARAGRLSSPRLEKIPERPSDKPADKPAEKVSKEAS